MNHANSGLASGTGGSPQLTLENHRMAEKVKENERKMKKRGKKRAYFKDGHITLNSISERREFFLGKSVKKD